MRSQQQLRGRQRTFAIQLDLTPAKPPVIHGRDGISQKAAGAGHASHYISFTRLSRLREMSSSMARPTRSKARAWMDHEFFSDAMDPSRKRMGLAEPATRRPQRTDALPPAPQDGSVDPYSSGTYIDAQGNCTFLSPSDFTMTPAGDDMDEPADQGAFIRSDGMWQFQGWAWKRISPRRWRSRKSRPGSVRATGRARSM